MARAIVVLVAGALAFASCSSREAASLASTLGREQVLTTFNATRRDYPTGLVHALFEAQARERGEATALVHGDERLGYAALNARANRLAHRLRERGIGPDDRVAICVERGIAMVVAVLGVLKAGGAYVPLDPAYPVPGARAGHCTSAGSLTTRAAVPAISRKPRRRTRLLTRPKSGRPRTPGTARSTSPGS